MKSRFMAILVAPFLIAIPSQALTPEAWIVIKDKNLSVITPVNGMYNLKNGEQFTAEVRLRADQAWTNCTLAFGWGSSSSFGGANLNTDFERRGFQTTGTYTEPYAYPKGLDKADAGLRPFGSYITNIKPKVAAGADVFGASWTFMNNLALGAKGELVIYNYGLTPTSISGVAIPTVKYTMNSIPEPSSLMAMGCAGVGVLGNVWHRRRRKTAAKS